MKKTILMTTLQLTLLTMPNISHATVTTSKMSKITISKTESEKEAVNKQIEIQKLSLIENELLNLKSLLSNLESTQNQIKSAQELHIKSMTHLKEARANLERLRNENHNEYLLFTSVSNDLTEFSKLSDIKDSSDELTQSLLKKSMRYNISRSKYLNILTANLNNVKSENDNGDLIYSQLKNALIQNEDAIKNTQLKIQNQYEIYQSLYVKVYGEMNQNFKMKHSL